MKRQDHSGTEVAARCSTTTAVDAFWEKVVKDPSADGHWIFTGTVSKPDGYGRIGFRTNGRLVMISAHRFALWIAGYDISDPHVVADRRCNERT